jgi:hypothetical protein
MGQRATTPYAAWIAAGYLPNIGTSHNYPLTLQPHGGNVGIGETSPDARLDIRSSGASSYPLLIKSSDDQQLFRFREESDSRGTFYINDASENSKVTLASSGNSSFMGGNVGIGTTSPNDTLVVFTDASNKGITIHSGSTSSFENPTLTFIDQGNSTSTLAVKSDNFCFTTYSTTNALQVIGSSGLTKANAGLEVTGTTNITSSTNMLLTLNPTAGNYGGILYQYGGAIKGTSIYNSGMMVYGGEANVSTSLQAGGQYGLFIHHSTRWVGVGMSTATPTSVLNVRGDGGSLGLTFKTEDASANETFYIMDGGRVGVRYGPLLVGIPSGTTPATSAVFQVEEAGLLTVLSTGKVGIGTTTPVSELHVQGNIAQQGTATKSVSSGTGDSGINLYTIHNSYARGSGRLRVMGMENNLNVGYAEYFYAYSYYGANGTYYVNLKFIDEAFVSNTYGRPRLYLYNSSSYNNNATNRQNTNQAANSTNSNILQIGITNVADQYGSFQIVAEPMHWKP